MSRLAPALLLCASALLAPSSLHAQNLPPATSVPPSTNPAVAPPASSSRSPFTYTPLHTAPLSPGVLELLKLEGQFSEAVSAGGGKAFSSWFADDGITLNNGQPAVLEGAQMGPSNDTGFTWGHYDATTLAKDGKSVTTAGRYITFWKKVHGEWKVALDASANEPPPTNGLPTP
jgi:hypothetical protein